MERSDNMSLDIYLSELDDLRNRPLDANDEKELFCGWENKSLNEKKEVRETLIRRNLRFAIRVATRYRGSGLAMEDLVSLANIGLLRATEKFDPKHGYRFISYAVWWIKEAILKALNNETDAIRFPASQKKDLHLFRRCQAEFYSHYERMPSDEEVMEYTGINKNQLRCAKFIQLHYASLDERIGHGTDRTLLDQTPDQFCLNSDSRLEQKELRQITWSMIDSLAPRDADIIIRYFGLNGDEPQTLEEIGKIYGITRERVRQVKRGAIEGLEKKPLFKRLAVELLR